MTAFGYSHADPTGEGAGSHIGRGDREARLPGRRAEAWLQQSKMGPVGFRVCLRGAAGADRIAESECGLGGVERGRKDTEENSQ